MALRILVRGGGDLASGVVLRLARIGCQVIVTELAQPVSVRRAVSFSQAVYDGRMVIEQTEALLASSPAEAGSILSGGKVCVFVDPDLSIMDSLYPDVLVDARMMKQELAPLDGFTGLFIGLGPGFRAGYNCQAAVETKRGPKLGRVFWDGPVDADTGIPEAVGAYREERVLRAPCDGIISTSAEIGAVLLPGEVIASVGQGKILAPFKGVLRGLVADGLSVRQKMKVGDVDPRGDPRLCFQVSDKALAIGGGVMEAILSLVENRRKLGFP